MNAQATLTKTPTMTQAQTIRGHLEAGKGITQMHSMMVYGIARLSSVIERLRVDEKLDIATLMKRDEAGRQYSEYRLARPVVAGCQVQMRPGHGYGLPNWVLKNKAATVLSLVGDVAFVEFKRGMNKATVSLNVKELVNVTTA